MKTKLCFNYFCAGVCVKYVGEEIMISLVEYYDPHSENKNVCQIRIPGGTVQFIDIMNAIQKVAVRAGLEGDKLVWLKEQVNAISQSYEKKILGMPATTTPEKLLVRNIFVSCLQEAEQAVESLMFNGNSLIIENAAKEETLRRELKSECAVTTWESVIESGFVERNGHFKYPFLVLGSDIPEVYKGSADEDIKRSFLVKLSELHGYEVYKPHQSFLDNTLNKLLQILEYEQKTKAALVSQIKQYLKPSN